MLQLDSPESYRPSAIEQLQYVLCVCMCYHPIYFGRQVFVDVPAGVTHEEGHTGFLHLPSAVLALIFLARGIQPFLSLVDREVEFLCTNELFVLHLLGIFIFIFCDDKSQFV